MTVEEKITQVITVIEESTNFDIMSEMKAALNSVYGEERNQIVKPSFEGLKKEATNRKIWATMYRSIDTTTGIEQVRSYIDLVLNTALSYQIVIHFPEITIKNNTKSHLIRDMYVFIYVKPNGLLYSSIKGARTTFTEAELSSAYIHSHLPRLDPGNIFPSNFCTGVGEINQVLAVLSTKYTSANFMMLLMHVKNFLEWESKEGHPYMHIESIFSRSSGGISLESLPYHLIVGVADRIVDSYFKDLDIDTFMEMFKFVITDTQITAQTTLTLEKWIADVMKNWDLRLMFSTSYTIHYFLAIRDSEGNYHPVQREDGSKIAHQKQPILNFKGTDKFLEIIDKKITQKSTHEELANPKITKQICEKLSRRLTRAALSSTGIISGSSIVCNPGTTETSDVPVQRDMDGRMVGDALL